MRAASRLLSAKTIRGKFLLFTTSLTLVPMVILSIVFYQIAAMKLGANAEARAYTMLQTGENSFEQLLSDLDDLSFVIMGDSQIQATLAQKLNEYEYLQNLDKINRMMQVYTQSKPYLTGYLVCSNAYGYCYSNGASVQGLSDYLTTEDIEGIKRKLRSEEAVQWIDRDSKVWMIRSLKRMSGEYEDIGFLLLELDKKLLFQGIKFINTPDLSHLIIRDRDRTIYRLPEESGEPTSEEGFVSYKVDNKRTGWEFIYLLNRNELLKDAKSIRKITIYVFLAVFLVGWIVAHRMGNSIRLPLRKLRLLMSGRPIPKANGPAFDSEDEVGQIGDRFLHLMDENKNLHQNLYNELLKRKEAEIQTLQAQINPHFLYNTLESLNGMAISTGHKDMSYVLGALGKFFRIALSKGNEFIRIEEEIEHVSSYVKIQQFRFKDRLEWIVEVEPELQGFYIPKLILQPIVENAIYHGLKNKEAGGIIFLSAERTDDGITFSITDDGLGMKEERLTEIVRSLEEDGETQSFGLKNVHNRLHLRFGAKYGIQVASEHGKYTTVRVNVPVIESMKKETDQ